MAPAPRVSELDDPQLRPFVPLLFIAWSDGDVSPSERRAIAARIEAQPWLRPAARRVLEGWLAQPPTPNELEALSELTERAASSLPPDARRTLAGFARELAAEEDREAMEQVLAALGIDAAPVLSATQSAHLTNDDAELSAALAAAFDGPHAELRARVRAFLDDPGLRAYGLPGAEYRERVLEWTERLAAEGFGELAFPGVFQAGDLRAFTALFETLALGDLSLLVKVGVQFGLFGGSLLLLGTDRHHALLPDVARGELLGCFAMSEVGHGSNVAGLETTATYDASTREFVVHTPSESARKEWLGNAARHASHATVFAQLTVAGEQHGVHALLVPIRGADGAALPGVRIGDSGHKMGLLGVDNGRLWFDQVRVPRESLLDRFAQVTEDGRYLSSIESPARRFFTMLGTLVGGRVSVGSAGVSVAKVALTIALRYAHARRQFGEGGAERALIEYPTHQRRLCVPLATTAVLHFAFESLRDRYGAAMQRSLAGEAVDTRELEVEVAALKIAGSRHGVDTAQLCREACGGQGYLSVNRIPDLRKDVEIFTTFEGDNIVLAQLVAKGLLAGYKASFEGRSWFALLVQLGGDALSRAAEKNPIATRRVEPAHLRDPELHLSLLRHREARLIETAAERLRRRLSAGVPMDTAILAIQEHLVAAAEAYAERLGYQWFCERMQALPAGAAKDTLERLGALHALATLERRAAWFLESGLLAPSKARALRKEVEALLAEVARDSRAVVDAFCIPDACLAAPVAFFDPAHPRYA
ncbi:MAG: acyl-CoA dehydrogenase family protein [Polyangiaceae bacterium]|nr:acyl-CoA dehydrogenase family protein [Polyangiaceae bacterium]MCW5790669.1 acyl-CoA dehydrogenase family protein [Polyangiaceae bacterium]